MKKEPEKNEAEAFEKACKLFNDAFDKEIAEHDFPVLDYDMDDEESEIENLGNS